MSALYDVNGNPVITSGSGGGWAEEQGAVFESISHFLQYSDAETGQRLMDALARSLTISYVPDGFCKVTTLLDNCTISNTTSSVEYGSSFSATLTPVAGRYIDDVVVLIGDENITDTAYSNNSISIQSVTDDVVITVITKPSDNKIDISQCTTGGSMPDGTVISSNFLITPLIAVNPGETYKCNITRYYSATETDFGQKVYRYASDETYKSASQITTNQPMGTMGDMTIADDVSYIRLLFRIEYRDIVYFGKSGVLV